MEEIYSHFQVPLDKSNSLFNTTYTKDAAKRMRKQQKTLNKKLVQQLEMFINRKDDVVKHVFNFEKEVVVHIPVHFKKKNQNGKTLWIQ